MFTGKIGKIPDWATQVAVSGWVANGNVTLYTVPADTVLYLATVHAQSYHGGAGACFNRLRVMDSVPAMQYEIITHNLPAGDHEASQLSFNPPIEIPATYLINIISNVAIAWIYAFIHGYTT